MTGFSSILGHSVGSLGSAVNVSSPRGPRAEAARQTILVHITFCDQQNDAHNYKTMSGRNCRICGDRGKSEIIDIYGGSSNS